MSHILSGLSAIDDSLFLKLDQSPSHFTSFDSWMDARLYDGFDSSVLINAVIFQFSIKTLKLSDDKKGHFCADGFFSDEYQMLFTATISESHANGTLGFLVGDHDISVLDDTSLFVSAFLSKKLKSLSHFDVSSVFVVSGCLYAKIKNKPLLIETLPFELAIRLEGASFTKNDASHAIWGSDYPENLLSIITKNSGSLVVVSGDNTKDLMGEVRKEMERTPQAKAVSLYDIQSLISKQQTLNITSRNEVAIVFSESTNFVDLLSELEEFASTDEILRLLNYYEIRLGIEKLCGECRESVPDSTSFDQLSLGVILSGSDLAKTGCGCDECLKGYTGITVAKEKMLSREIMLRILLDHKVSMSSGNGSVYQILEEFKTNKIPTVYSDLVKLIKHKDVCVFDGASALL